MRLRTLSDPDFLPALDTRHALQRLVSGLATGPQHPPRILLLYGSLRERSYSRLVVEEAARLLRFFGAEPRIFDPSDLPLPDQVRADDHPAVHELRKLSMWSDGQIWCSPERHGQITGVMKAQIDHLPLNMGGIRPTQGRQRIRQLCRQAQAVPWRTVYAQTSAMLFQSFPHPGQAVTVAQVVGAPAIILDLDADLVLFPLQAYVNMPGLAVAYSVGQRFLNATQQRLGSLDVGDI